MKYFWEIKSFTKFSIKKLEIQQHFEANTHSINLEIQNCHVYRAANSYIVLQITNIR